MTHAPTVSCKVLRSLFTFLIKRGVSEAEIFERVSPSASTHGLTLSREKIFDPRARVPWDLFIDFLEALSPWMKDPDLQLAYMSESPLSENTWIPYVQFLGRMLSSPVQAYRINHRMIAPNAFGPALIQTLEELSDGRLLVTAQIADESRGSRLFFELSRMGMRKAPSLIGLPDSFVEAEISERECRFLITPPPSATVLARFIRALKMFFSTPSLLEAMESQEKNLRSSYDRLLISESQLRGARAELEARVADRTRDLALANQRLHERIEEIERKEKENLLLSERLAHLQKLEAVGTLAGGIAHEINNILHGITLSIELADRKIAADHPAKDKVQVARDFAVRGQDLVKQVLAFSRKTKLQPRPLPLVTAVREAARLMRSTIPKSITLLERYPSDSALSPWILGDETQIQQIVINLCANAAFALRGRSGIIQIDIQTQPGGKAALVVRDTGEGIPDEVLERIFDPFFTTKPVGEGTGMGLAVVDGIAKSLGGSIRVESSIGVGSEFRVILPTIARENANEIEATEPDMLGGSERILVVDDEPELLSLLSDTLSAFGYTVAVARNGDEALKLFSSADFDLVLTDHLMPGMNGVELAKRIKALRPSIPVLLCTGQTETGESLAPIAHCVTKPLDAISLNEAIRSVLGQDLTP